MATFKEGFRHGSPMTLPVFEMSDAGLRSSGKGEKIFMTI
jgi:hypothetical protein